MGHLTKKAKMGQDLRLQVALARLGLASRRAAAEIIRAGRVKVNGRTVYQPGQRVELEKDTITVDERKASPQKKLYIILNKPRGVVTTLKDRYAACCVVDLIRPKGVRIYPVGRLDKDTTGLLLLTNDGELTYRLTHPKFGIKKVYRVWVEGDISPEELRRLAAGIFLEGKKRHPSRIKLIGKKGGASRVEIELVEGRKRQIKKMFAFLGHPVRAIERTGFGPLKLRGLHPGQWRKLKRRELNMLKKAAGVV